MRVAIVTESGEADAVRGIGVYTRELLSELKKLENNNFRVDLVNKDNPNLTSYQILHYPDFRVYFSYPKLIKGIKTVVTIHDVIPLIYPKQYPGGLKGYFKLMNQELLLKKVETIITVSETSKKDIVRLLNIPANKIQVTYEAPRSIFVNSKKNSEKLVEVRKKYNLPDKFVLYVGDVNYNKNILGLTEACKLANISLVMVGKQAADIKVNINHPENSSFKEFLDKYKNDKKIIRLGFVSDEDLVNLYYLAKVYCFPSFYEGFGLSVLEAFACGTPVVISKTQSLVEVAENAALVADPYNPNDIADKIIEISKNINLKEKQIALGRKRASEFNWEKTAKETLQAYISIAKI